MFIPVADVEAAASGKRVAFVADEHSKRRLVVLLPDGQELPGQLAGRSGGGGNGGQRGSNQAFVGELGWLLLGCVRELACHSRLWARMLACPRPAHCQVATHAAVAKLAAVLQRALRIDEPTATL